MNGTVDALEFYSEKLIAGGSFTIAGGTTASRIAEWNGVSWSSLGAGSSCGVEALTVYDEKLIAACQYGAVVA